MFHFPAAGLLVFLPISGMVAQTPKTKVEELSWLTGTWSSTNKGAETEESWSTAKGGLILGTNRTVKTGSRSTFEYLRIAETEKGLSYFASPMGKPATEFPLKAIEKNTVTFENLQNDFPQRIIYRLEDGKLHARIEGTINGKERSLEWVWSGAAK